MNKIKVVLPFMTTMNFHKNYEGGDKYIYYFSKELAKQGIDVTIVTTQLENREIKEKFENGVRYVFLPPRVIGKRLFKLNSPYRLLFSYNLKKYLEKTDFDILHSFGPLAYFYLHKSRKKRKPVISQPWGFAPFYLPESLSQKGIKKVFLKYFIQHPWLYCSKKADLIAIEGDFELPLIRDLGLDKNKTFSLPIGIDLEVTKKFKKNYRDIRKKFNFSKKDLVLLAVNQVSPDKGVDLLINSFALLKKKIKHSKLIVVGSGSLEGMMQNLIKKHKLENDVVHLKGIPEKELYDCYFSSDIFVCAQTQQNVSVSVQEAMACGLPIVSFDQVVLVKNDKNGIAVKNKNSDGLKEGILKIYRGDMRKLGAGSLDLIKNYTWETIAKTAITKYKELLKQ
ncbi:MAG: glycosyltransferase family 4 protein [Nanoarchaeota archaeon]|nr:glycosyltransferase family 4 protein [Nanoarchaeota archaeon]